MIITLFFRQLLSALIKDYLDSCLYLKSSILLFLFLISHQKRWRPFVKLTRKKRKESSICWRNTKITTLKQKQGTRTISIITDIQNMEQPHPKTGNFTQIRKEEKNSLPRTKTRSKGLSHLQNTFIYSCILTTTPKIIYSWPVEHPL